MSKDFNPGKEEKKNGVFIVGFFSRLINNIKNGYKKFKHDTADMNFHDKMEHFWEYYGKMALFVAVCLAVVLTIVITGVINVNTEVIVSGATVNVDLSLEGADYVSEGFYQTHKTEGRQRVDYSNVYMYAEGTTDNIEHTYDTIQGVVAQVGAKELDYLIMDEIGFGFLVGHEIFMDLNEFFTQEELAAFGDKIIYAQEENSEKQVPLAINISDCEFLKENAQIKNQTVYFSPIVNTTRKDTCKEFLNYILDYKK